MLLPAHFSVGSAHTQPSRAMIWITPGGLRAAPSGFRSEVLNWCGIIRVFGDQTWGVSAKCCGRWGM